MIDEEDKDKKIENDRIERMKALSSIFELSSKRNYLRSYWVVTAIDKEQRMREYSTIARSSSWIRANNLKSREWKDQRMSERKSQNCFADSRQRKNQCRNRDKAIGDDLSSREAQTANVSKKRWRKNETSKGTDGLYISRKRRNGRSAALHPNGSRQIDSEDHLPASRNRPPFRRSLLYKYK